MLHIFTHKALTTERWHEVMSLPGLTFITRHASSCLILIVVSLITIIFISFSLHDICLTFYHCLCLSGVLDTITAFLKINKLYSFFNVLWQHQPGLLKKKIFFKDLIKVK